MKTYIIPLIILLFFGCQNNSGEQSASAEAYYDENMEKEMDSDFQIAQSDESPPNPQTVQDDQKTNVAPRLIIKNGDMRMQVADVEASTAKTIAYTQSIGGYMSQMETVNSNYETSNRLTLRIPADKFEDFLTKMGEESLFTDYRRVGTEDVSAEYIDLQARLKTRREVKARYETILREKTKTVEDVLNAEEKIRHLQEEIESAEGRLKYLSDRSSMSKVNVDLYERKEYEQHPVSYSESFWVKLKEGLLNGWEVLTSTLLFFVNIWPFTLLLLGIWFGRKRIFKRFYKKKKEA